MFEFLDPQYRSTSNLVNYQDWIINRAGINVDDVDKYIKELNKYNILFNSFMGLNQVPNSNIIIRQNVILAALYYIKGEKDKAKKYKILADETFLNLKRHWIYLEGFSYFLYVKMAYDFYLKFVPQFFAGNVDTMTFTTMEKVYAKFASPDKKVPTTDTAFIHEIYNEEKLNYVNELYSVHYLNNTGTYIFVNHNKTINDYSKNFHMNYEFGHFCIFHDGKWLLKHPFYPGYDMKQKTNIKEAWNHNIIYGSHCKEPVWRYLPKQKLEWEYKNGTYNFKIGKSITRKIEIMSNGIVVSDSGGDYSSFNIADDLNPNCSGTKVVEKLGYHAPTYGVVEPHKRIEIYGNHRLFALGF